MTYKGLRKKAIIKKVYSFLYAVKWRNELAENIHVFEVNIRFIQVKWRFQILYAETRMEQLKYYWKDEYERFLWDLNDSKEKDDKILLR